MGDVLWNMAGVAGCDALQACDTFGVGFGVERDVLEICAALVAVEAGWVKTLAGSRENTAGNRKGTVSAEGARLTKGGSVVGCRFWNGRCVRVMVQWCLLSGCWKRAMRRGARW